MCLLLMVMWHGTAGAAEDAKTLSGLQLDVGPLDCPRPVGSTCFRSLTDPPYRSPAPAPPPRLSVEVANTTYVYNVESQGTFIKRSTNCQGFFCFRKEQEVNGFTAVGDFTSLRLRYTVSSTVSLYGGVFFAIPFGGADAVRQVRPIITLNYQPVEGVNLLAGTLQPRHPFHDAVFDDLRYFLRPVEQGLQFLVDRKYYQQDLFFNWYQENTRENNERFDIGYAGKLKVGPVRLNAQLHWDHGGGEIPFPDFRTISAQNNIVWAGGPEVAVLSPMGNGGLIREIGAAVTLFGDRDEPNQRTPALTSKGHAHELRGWVNLGGFRLSAARWKSSNFVTSTGDIFYGVEKMTEVNFVKFFDLNQFVAIEVGGWVRFIDRKSVDASSGGVPANSFYAAFHWNFDVALGKVNIRPAGPATP
ncbi:MAG: hypothetical protein E8D45_10215 [Nitrospira sp.]|nr:MAG: hypothetical protein E8D45_10215 [Nitrospira sp.]